ncbi:MAG: pyridoxal kinase PdxY [Rhodobacteraceae bacterium]|nr:pyridoxal kinase PdxY [Paracoccaceae bacterium]
MAHVPEKPSASAPTILVVTSQVVRGGISGRGLLFALERLGHNVWFVPTILLPWHPGHGKATRIVPPVSDFAALIDDLAGSEKLGEIRGVITGYLGGPEQAAAIAKLVKAVKTASPEALYLCDPVMGDHFSEDHGGLYIPEPTAEAVRDELVPLADIVTPNRFELGWLTDQQVETETQALNAARQLGSDRVLVTSSPAMRRNSISNLLVTQKAALAAEHQSMPKPPNGTGDLISGLLLSNILAGRSDEDALMRSAASTFEVVARSVKQGADELLLPQEQDSIAQPMAMVSTRRVMEARRRVSPSPVGL